MSLQEGDYALRIFIKNDRPTGGRRFLDRYDGHIHRVRQVVGSKTYTLETLKGEVLRDNSNQDMMISGEELVRVDMPALELGLEEFQPTRLEVQCDRDHNVWYRGTLEGVSPEGKVFLRYDAEPEIRRHVDLTTLSYRWLYGETLAPGAAVEGPNGLEAVAASALRTTTR